MTARPAPLTPYRERKVRSDLEYGFSLDHEDAEALVAMLDATRAQLAAVTLEHQACPACGEAYLRAGELQVQIDALREVSACRAALEEVGYTGSLPVGVYDKLADERRELAAKLAETEQASAKMRDGLRACELWRQDLVESHTGRALEYIERERRRDEIGEVLRAALSPTQPTPTEGNES